MKRETHQKQIISKTIMAKFKNLPNEIILLIWDFLDVEFDDVFNFSIASKKIYPMVRDDLREHLRLQKRLWSIGDYLEGDGVPLVEILKEILLNPRAACYPIVLSLQDPFWEQPEMREVRPQSLLEDKDLVLIKDAVRVNINASEEELEKKLVCGN